jgi:tRNA (guanine37-N1)-methyltransferase
MKKPTFHFITLFPDCIEVWLKSSILGRAYTAGLFGYELIQLRNFAFNKHASVDDAAYGGGGGMVLKVEPLVTALESVWEKVSREKARVIYFSPAGQRIDQAMLKAFSSQSQWTDFVFICGHYEGIDQRFIDHWVDEEISLGDFVITGGELPAVAFADGLIRQLEGTLGAPEGHETESFLLEKNGKKLIEYPHYTRPAEFQGHRVPEVLLKGDHAAIEKWRMAEAQKRTELRRPDLIQ